MIVIERPTTRQRVMDIVAQAGIDVSDWANASGHPAKNPKYRSEWCFEKPGKLVLLSLWYEEMKEEKGQIFQLLNYKALAITSGLLPNRPHPQAPSTSTFALVDAAASIIRVARRATTSGTSAMRAGMYLRTRSEEHTSELQSH